MSYGSDLNTIMTGDSSLNALCDGGIFFENLPDNFDLTDAWIVYSFRRIGQQDCLTQKNTFTSYAITAKIVTYDSVLTETISDYLANYLNGISQGGIMDIWVTSDNHQIDLERGVYMNSLDFESFYVPRDI